MNVITPRTSGQRGCQLSIEIVTGEAGTSGKQVHRALEDSGIETDWREPNVIRAAPVPLYNSFSDVFRFVERLRALVIEE